MGHGLYDGEEFALVSGVVTFGFGQGHGIETNRVLTGAVGLFKNSPYGYGGRVGLEDDGSGRVGEAQDSGVDQGLANGIKRAL